MKARGWHTLLLLAAWLTLPVSLASDVSDFSTREQQDLYDQMIQETRCPECRNQSLAEATDISAANLRVAIADLVRMGMEEDEIKAWLVERYGDGVLYDPRLRWQTAVLWFMPPVLLAAGLALYTRVVLRRARQLTERTTVPGASRT